MLKYLSILFLFAFLGWSNFVQAKLQITTYNLGLATGYVPFSKERAVILPNALKESLRDSKVLCFQEVWNEADVVRISEELKEQYPYQILAPKAQKYSSIAPVCKPKNLFGEGKVITCLRKNCLSKSGDEFTACVSEKCQDAMNLLVGENRLCANALFAQVGKNPAITILEVLNPFKKIGLFSYEGAVGTMLLSKIPFTSGSAQFTDLATLSTTVHRGILSAQIENEGIKYWVACNHLTANLSLAAPYAGPAHSWEEENLVQVEKLVNMAKEKGHDNVKILMGDFNCGLASSNVSGDFEKSCQAIMDQGYSDSLYSKNPDCTYCLDNKIVGMTKEVKSYQLDHTFVSGIEPSLLENKIVLKNNYPLSNGQNVPLSDHYGLNLILP